LRVPVVTGLGVDIMFKVAFRTVNDWQTKIELKRYNLSEHTSSCNMRKVRGENARVVSA
jgi:hypothetical protein